MSSRKDFIRAAEIVREYWRLVDFEKVKYSSKKKSEIQSIAESVECAFVSYFRNYNFRFDVDKFRDACKFRKGE